MIQTFADDATADIFNGVNSKAARRMPKALWNVIRRRLDALHAAPDLAALAAVQGHRLELLKGNLAGRHSIRVNEKYRITFVYTNGDAYDVCCQDYHRG